MSKTAKRLIALAAVVLILVGLIVAMFANMNLKAAKTGSLYGTPGELSPTVVREFLADENAPEGMKLAYSEGNLSIYIDEETCNVAVRDAKTGKMWSTTPFEEDEKANGDPANRLLSQLYITYYNDESNSGHMNSYSDAVKIDQYTIEAIEKGVRITYTLGERTIVRNMLPQVLTAERFQEKILSSLEGEEHEAAKAKLLQYYIPITISKLPSYSKPLYENLYPDIDKDTEYYILHQNCPVYEYDPIYRIIFESTEYTLEDMEKDHKENKVEVIVSEVAQFVIPVEFTVSDGDFLARIITSKIESPDSYVLTDIRFNEFFGAGGLNDTGYLFVPDGSGALVNFNNGKPSSNDYNLPVYSKDKSYKSEEGADEEPATVLAPVFGIKNNDAAFLAVIESGDTHATISAENSGNLHSFNQAYAEFNVRPFDRMAVDTTKGVKYNNRYQQEAYKGDCTIRYIFTDTEKSNYVGMAEEYRDYLTERGELVKKDTSTVPFVTEFLGQTKMVKNIFGVPITDEAELTSFEEAAIITNLLAEKGVKNTTVKYSSWVSGSGLYPSAASKASVSKKIGGKNGLIDLNTNLAQSGDTLYLNVPIMNVYSSAPKFNQWSYANRLTYNQIANQRFYDVATYQQVRDKYYTISSRYLLSYVTEYVERLEKAKIEKLWFEDIASDVNSDFRKNQVVDRQVAKDFVLETLAYLDSETSSIGFDSPNAYAWKYADSITNLPLGTSGHRIADEEIPFIQIVLSGTISYTGSVINTSGNDRYQMLKAVETGAGLYFKWIYSDNTEVMDMSGEEPLELYSLYYGDWIDTAAEYYSLMTEKVEGLIGTEIIAHEKLQYNVYKTTYSGGSVIVNYNDYEVTIGDVTIAAEDFEVIK